MREVMISILVTASMFVMSYFTMVYGWGLEPKSFAWIIGGSVYFIFAGLLTESGK